MKPKEFLKAFIEDCKYYDIEKKEIKTILKNVDVKDKTILDIGAGVGRLSFPLSKSAKEVTALDNDKRLKDYFKKRRKRNIRFINQKAEKFLESGRKFDLILLVWPTINFRIINSVKKAMHKDTKFILLTCDNNSDYEKNLSKLSGEGFKKDLEFFIKNKKKFIKNLPKKFKIIFKRKIDTEYTYPNEKIAFEVIKNAMKLWFNTKLSQGKENKLKKIIKKHKKGKKIIFNEKVWFCVMEKK